MDVTAVVVHYHTPTLARACVLALRDDFAKAGVAAEIVLVDNGSRASERSELASLPARLVVPERNLGYAGGVNIGLHDARSPLLLVLNADVLVLPGCVGALTRALAAADVAGPRFFWDEERRLVLPPAERRRRRAELLRALATRGGVWARWARRSFRRHARRHWQAESRLASDALSGALLAFRRTTWESVGPFDEAYRLYFEESDWLARAKRRGARMCYVPQAEALHHYNQAAQREPAAERWFAESEARFARRYYGRAYLRLRDAFAVAPARSDATARLPDGLPRVPAAALRDAGDGAWVEISGGALRYPAAADRHPSMAGEWSFPPSVWRDIAPGEYFLAIVDAGGRERAVWAFAR
jgi:GT2 family glycosyltransferase